MAFKPYVSTLEPEQIDWIKKTHKKVGFKRATDFVREIIREAQTRDHKELGQKFMKARLENELNQARSRAEEAAKEQERLEKQLQEIGE